MKRHKGEDPEHLFPRMRNWKLNTSIREGLHDAGIDRVVTTINPKTGASEQHPICDVASSHMARRTFIGNLYKQVKDPALIASLTGHTENSVSFTRYRAIDDDTKRDILKMIE
jgi:integrase